MASRSSFLLWLLLLATISVTAVAAMWMFDEGLDGTTATVFWGLTFGELSVLCAAMMRSEADFRVSWILPFLFGLLAALVMTFAAGFPFDDWDKVDFSLFVRLEPLTSYTVLYWLHAVAAILVLWLLRPTALFTKFSNRAPGSRWRFSVMHLLVLMTCVAVLCTTITRAVLINQGWDEIISTATLPIANGLLLFAVLWATQSTIHFLARLSICMSAAMIIAAICGTANVAFADEINIFVLFLLQSLIMWVWFELMRPVPPSAAIGDAQTQPAASP